MHMATIVYVIAKNGFRDEEYFIPREVLVAAEHVVVTASNGEAGSVATGSRGGEAHIDVNIGDADIKKYDAVIYAGGPGALENLDNEQSHHIIRETVSARKLLGAICIAPTILAKAGVLRGKKATVWSTPNEREGIAALQENGAEYIDAPVVKDGSIITASGPKAAQAFGEALVSWFV